MRYIRRPLECRSPGTTPIIVLAIREGGTPEPIPSAVNRPLARRLLTATPRRQRRCVCTKIILRPVVDVIVERPRAELILLALLEDKDVFTRIRHTHGIVANVELRRFRRSALEEYRELVESVI